MNDNDTSKRQIGFVTEESRLGRPGDLYYIYVDGQEDVPWQGASYNLVGALEQLSIIRKLGRHKTLHMIPVHEKLDGTRRSAALVPYGPGSVPSIAPRLPIISAVMSPVMTPPPDKMPALKEIEPLLPQQQEDPSNGDYGD